MHLIFIFTSIIDERRQVSFDEADKALMGSSSGDELIMARSIPSTSIHIKLKINRVRVEHNF